ncbi:MAG: 1,6-anhydro-N-acetylmuramyl-L-alanine amidase AmpD [Woeseiaceae bacterium]|jgi:AmpD protein|nr:1,6-anhydro-N-acetylmuramyl-L-alanine amidase AmpD [Woeseiaceae bacterium]|tara:strand:- start:367 stop:969 length:603 start_codon:yes stop_codon:yes gene_type:complete
MKEFDKKSPPSLSIDPKRYLLPQAQYFESPNYDHRPSNVNPEIIVIHGISLPPGEYGFENIKDFFLNTLDHNKHPFFLEIKHLRVSSHLLIDRSGEVYQFVPLDKRAWHAGESSFRGKHNCNDFSIGIELEGEDNIEYSTSQYDSLVRIIDVLIKFYPFINARNIVAHSDIAPNRKTDPGPAFDWFSLYDRLNEEKFHSN